MGELGAYQSQCQCRELSIRNSKSLVGALWVDTCVYLNFHLLQGGEMQFVAAP